MQAAQVLLPNGAFDSPKVDWYWEDWSAAGSTVTFDPAQNASGGATGSGSLRLRGNFGSSSAWQQTAFTLMLPSPVNASALYTEISCDVRVDPSSVARPSGDYGLLRIVLRNESGWVWTELPLQRLTGTAWKRLTWKLADAKGPIDALAAITLNHGDEGLRGPVILNVDNIAFLKKKLPQTISFPALPQKNLSDAPFALSATASSGLPVSFAIVSGPATLQGNTLTLGGLGTVVIRASQAGNADYDAAPAVDQSLTVIERPLEGPTYGRIEAGFSLGGLSSDPAVLFDYARTDVQVTISGPDSSQIRVPAFYDGGTTWRVRHAPTRPGPYQIGSITVNGAPASAVSNLSPSNWVVNGFPESAGYVRIDPSNPRRFVTSDGRRYFPIGHNAAWSSPEWKITDLFPKMGAARENWSRVWMTAFYDPAGLGLNLDWPKINNSFGQLSLPVARNWDALVMAAEKAGIHFQMVFQHHGQYSTTVNPNWNDNPYNAARGGFLANPASFFSDATAKALTKRKLRYAIARWGYSASVMAWELFNEVQLTDAGLAGQTNLIGAWHEEMAAFVRAQDPYRHLITTSSDHFTDPMWNSMDYYQAHNYAADIIATSRDAVEPPANPAKPVFAGESTWHDSSSPARVWAHPPLWAGLMSGQAGGSCPWWWETIDQEQSYSLFRACSDFVNASAFADQNELVKTAPRVTGGALSALTFSLGGGWGTAAKDTFEIGAQPPPELTTAPNFLQGQFHSEMTPNGYTFAVNYPQEGTFSVEVKTIALSGAGLRILTDGVVKTNLSFPATTADVQTNLTVSIPVPAGPHTIKLVNPGKDWVALGNFVLTPYAPGFGAYAIGNSRFTAAWIWNRATILNPAATGATSGTLDVSGLGQGSYFGTWWDTFQAGSISNFNFTVSGPNTTVTLQTPAFLRSIAFYASPNTNGPAGRARPEITRQPESKSVDPGKDASFSVAGTGTAPIAIQWRKDGVAIPGATFPTLTIRNAAAANSGNYTVVVTNSIGATTSIVAVLSVSKSAQTVSFDTIPNQTYGAGSFALAASASSGLPISFTIVSGPATLSGNLLTITGAGEISVRATQNGNQTYEAANSVERTFTASKAALRVQANHAARRYGESNPPFSATIMGFVRNDTAAAISGTPSLATTANAMSAAGTYSIIAEPGTLASVNYTFDFSEGVLTVSKADQSIAFAQIPGKILGDPAFALSASASSGLPVSFSIVTGPARLEGSMLTLTNTGTVTIRATQSGDANHHPAPAVENIFNVALPAEIRISNVRIANWRLEFEWSARAGASYRVYGATNILAGPWTLLERISASGPTASFATEIDPAKSQFYIVENGF